MIQMNLLLYWKMCLMWCDINSISFLFIFILSRVGVAQIFFLFSSHLWVPFVFFKEANKRCYKFSSSSFPLYPAICCMNYRLDFMLKMLSSLAAKSEWKAKWKWNCVYVCFWQVYVYLYGIKENYICCTLHQKYFLAKRYIFLVYMKYPFIALLI